MAEPRWIRSEFGRLLHEARIARSLSQQVLATISGLSRTSIANIEAGRQGVSLEVLMNLADALQVSPADLLPKSTSPLAPPLPDRLTKGLGHDEEAWVHRIVGGATTETRDRRG